MTVSWESIDKGKWIQSFSGKAVTPQKLHASQVTFSDIPHTLSQKVRFNGHLKEKGYSVAQHCVIGAELIPQPYALAFLLHEVSEVYLPDIPSPIKPLLSINIGTVQDPRLIRWSTLEAQHADVIFGVLGLSVIRELIESAEVHLMDLQMLMTERRDLMGPIGKNEPQSWNIDVNLLEYKISEVWSADVAERKFIDLFNKLVLNSVI